jgi:hypothetical protein
MRKDCWIQPQSIQEELEDFFSEVDSDLSSFYEENPNTAEPQLDGSFIRSLTSKSFDLHAKRINAVRRRNRRQPVYLKIKATPITATERTYGADIGLVARVSVPGEHEITKAALVQSKRLYPNMLNAFDEKCYYKELFGGNAKTKVLPQWKRMLDQTASSYYFLYNPERLRIGKNLQTLKTRVLPAQVVAGMATSRAVYTPTQSVKLNSFSEWIVEEFVCCNVGDTRENVVEIAMGSNPDFPVRHSVVVVLDANEARAEDFSR